jgi:hypothetical protein
MSLAGYLDVRNSVVSQIRAAFADPRLVIEAHPGNFDGEELKRLYTRTPAVLNSLVRISNPDVLDESLCSFVSWVLYRANNQDLLYDGALKIVTALIPVIRGLDSPWCINGGRDIEAECLYSGALDKINVTLWAVRWRWQIRAPVLGEDEEGGGSGGAGILMPDDLEYFEGYDADHVIGTQKIQDEVHLEVSNARTDETNSG